MRFVSLAMAVGYIGSSFQDVAPQVGPALCARFHAATTRGETFATLPSVGTLQGASGRDSLLSKQMVYVPGHEDGPRSGGSYIGWF